MTTESLIKQGQTTALLSFLLGTAVFAFYYFTGNGEILFLGYGFIVVTGIINLIVLVQLMLRAGRDTGNRKKIGTTCGLMLLNIPIMLSYCYFTIVLLGIMRINFTNKTGSTVTDIHITGCEEEYLDALDPEASQTVWISIKGDCHIDVDYLLKGQRKKENVMGYVSGPMGTKTQYNIGGKNPISF